jgi:hypothetical protein
VPPAGYEPKWLKGDQRSHAKAVDKSVGREKASGWSGNESQHSMSRQMCAGKGIAPSRRTKIRLGKGGVPVKVEA